MKTMKTYKMRMSGRTWNISNQDNLLSPLDESDYLREKTVKHETSFLGIPTYLESENGTTFEEIQVGRSGWSNRGWDFYEIVIPKKAIKVQTRSYIMALKILRKFF